jgi:hypothetical protein
MRKSLAIETESKSKTKALQYHSPEKLMRASFQGLLITTLLFTGAAKADGDPNSQTGAQIEVPGSTKTSRQLLDKRLPPVVPGQEVTANGKKMNVWSTSGEVPVSQPPEPWRHDRDGKHLNQQGIGVIVDERRGRTGEGANP